MCPSVLEGTVQKELMEFCFVRADDDDHTTAGVYGLSSVRMRMSLGLGIGFGDFFFSLWAEELSLIS